MDLIHPNLYSNYKRWITELGDVSYPQDFYCLSVDDVLRAHFLLCDFFHREGEAIAAAGPRDKTLFLSAIDRQVAGFGGFKKWDDIFHKAATLFYGIIKNHPFYDGNKRTGLLCALHQLLANKRVPTGKQRDFEKLAVDTAANRLSKYSHYSSFERKGDPEVRVIAHFFRQNTRVEDKKLYVITFNQLRSILSRYGFTMEGPDRNLINVVEYKKSSILGIPFRTTRRLVAQVGCPRMTAEVNDKALKTILRECGLTADNGYDSQVVFKDESPLSALIDTFNGPLRRLRDK